jgi:hypothetical protein
VRPGCQRHLPVGRRLDRPGSVRLARAPDVAAGRRLRNPRCDECPRTLGTAVRSPSDSKHRDERGGLETQGPVDRPPNG